MTDPTPLVVFPDVVALCVDAIRAGFKTQGNTTAIANVLPDPAAPCVTVRRHGGPRRDLVTDQAQIGLESYARTAVEAHDNCQLARALVFAMRGTAHDGVAIYRIGELAGPQDLPDPISTLPRYVCTLVVAARGRALQT